MSTSSQAERTRITLTPSPLSVAADAFASAPTSSCTTASSTPPGSPDIPPHNTPKHPTFEKRISDLRNRPGRRPARALSGKQLLALELLLAGRSDLQVCNALKLNRKTLYVWKHRHPAFAAEFDRRARETWQFAADHLQHLVAGALDTVARHLGRRSSELTQLRAAKFLVGIIARETLVPPALTRYQLTLFDKLYTDDDPSAPSGRQKAAPGASPGQSSQTQQ